MLKKYKRKKGRKKKFSKQFKEHLRIGLSAATGFVIAFAWREPLILFVNDFFSKIMNSSINYISSIVSALVITFLGVVFIWVISKILK